MCRFKVKELITKALKIKLIKDERIKNESIKSNCVELIVRSMLVGLFIWTASKADLMIGFLADNASSNGFIAGLKIITFLVAFCLMMILASYSIYRISYLVRKVICDRLLSKTDHTNKLQNKERN